jgi:hypothetical protein
MRKPVFAVPRRESDRFSAAFLGCVCWCPCGDPGRCTCPPCTCYAPEYKSAVHSNNYSGDYQLYLAAYGNSWHGHVC